MRKKILLLSFLTALIFGVTPKSFAQIQKTSPIAGQVTALKNSAVSFKPVAVFSVDVTRFDETESMVKHATPVTIDFGKLAALTAAPGDAIEFTFPYDNKEITVELYQVDIFTGDFKVVTDKSGGEAVLYTPGVYYRGIVKGDVLSLASFSFFDGELMGMVSTNEYGNMNIGKSALAGAKSSDYIIYSDKNILNPPSSFCATFDDPAYAEKLKEYASGGGTVRTAKCVRMYYEVDNNIYINSGSTITGTTNWMTAVHNNVATLYSNDQVTTALSEIFIWSSQDPFTGSTSSARLNSFKSVRPSFNGDVGQLVAIDPGGLGGVASTINGLCSSSNKYCYADVDYSYNNVPTYSWTMMVLTHEFGHLLGSYHTHSCTWPVGALDNCYSTEGFCSPGPAPVGGGTIMSYCHLTSYGINFNNGFGQYPAAAIQGAVDAASCLSATCTGTCTPPAGLAASSITTSSATLNWLVSSGATSYNIQYRPTGSPSWTSTTSTTNSKAISSLSASTQYEFQVQTVCGATSSNYSPSANFSTPGPSCSDTYEPNNSKANAKPIAINTNIFAKIGSSSDKDWFSFSNSSGQPHINIDLTTLPKDYDIDLYNPSGSKLNSSQNAGLESENIVFNNGTVGTYKIRVYGYGGVFDATNCYTLFVTTSGSPFRFESSNIPSTTGMKMYPNPTSGELTVDYTSINDAFIVIKVYNVTGKELLTRQHSSVAGSNSYQLDVNHLSRGIYILEIKNGDEVTRSKFVIER